MRAVNTPETKFCPDCRVFKPRAEFSPRAGYCKPCAAARQRLRYKDGRNADKARAYSSWYRKAHPEKVAEVKCLWRASNKERARASMIKRKYGLSAEDYGRMYRDQGGCCAICRSALRGGRETHIDHCHGSGVVRGILCNNCNAGLGHYKDDPELMRAAARYIEEHRKDGIATAA